MKVRLLVTLSIAAIAIAIASCSSGLGNNLPNTPTSGETTQTSTNLPVGLDIGVELTDPAADSVVAGAVVPAIGAFAERDVVLVAFTTSDAGGDGVTANVSRDLVNDTNGAADVFVAAICAQEVNANAFSQSLAGKFRHPRCATCHSMQSPTTTAFVSAAASQGQPHAGPSPGASFPSGDAATCIPCHLNSTAEPVEDWKAPDGTFDLRTETVAALAARAQIPPTGDLEHFKTDPRVLWALDSGILPTVGGRNGVADDDHDGIDEPSDVDGEPRTVPGGSAVFIQQIDDWEAAGFPVTAADAVCDVTLVSRAASTTNAGDAASTRPQMIYVPNGSFTAPGTVGTLYIVYQSDATDLVAGDTNGATDVFRTAVDLISDASGNLSLQVNGNATLVSATNGTTNEGNGASTTPVIGGATGNLVAFQSQATDLVAGFTDGNGSSGFDVYVRNLGTNDTHLISHQTTNQATGGDGSSEAPSIDPTGVGVAFESDATDLIGSDTNGVRDVFYSDVSGSAPFTKNRASVTSAGAEGTGGASADASIYVAGGGRTLVAFESDKTDLAAALTATTNVYVFDSDSGNTTMLNRLLSTSLDVIGDGDARNPVIGADGANIAFESAATNIDILRSDENGAVDVFLVDVAQALAGNVLPYRYSLTTLEATDGNGDSTEPQFTTFASASSTYSVGFSVYKTAATNLGNSDSTDLIVAFLDETSGVVADFTTDVTSGAIPLTVQFTDASTGVPTAWEWDFDNDGNVDSTEQNPSYTFATAGSYTVTLTASNATTTNSVTKANLITAIGTPVPDFTATPTSGPASLAVTFTDTSTGDPTSWLWDFGDGSSTVTTQNPNHTYTTPGTYTVTMTATNVAGSATETKTNLIEVFTPVVAGFTPSTSSGTVPFAVTFTNTSTGATSYSWDFGDGSPTVTTENPTHTFTSSGSFTVTLTATGPGGTDMATTGITANGVVTASFTITISAVPATSGYEAQTVTLDASGSSNATSYAWDLDNNGSTDRTGVTVTDTIANLFPTSSQTAYTVKLTATGPGGSGSTTLPFTSVADSETIMLNATADNTIYQEATNNSNGAGTQLIVGRTAGTSSTLSRRGLVQFDISSVPAGSTVTNATLTLVSDTPAVTGNQSIAIRRLTQAWTEGSSNAGNPGGLGAVAAGGGATWANRTTPSTAWSSAGGSFAAATATIMVGAPGTDVSGDLSSDVQGWLDATFSNFGWALVGNEGATTTAKRFSTREGSNPPVLTVTYTRPLP
ncbi:MAG: beta strand repeat-containing protein [Planctomycetota bacterium]